MPGWVFYPTNLRFFLEWERSGFRRRQNYFGNTGDFPCRRPPAIENFQEQCAGLYSAMILDDFGPHMPGEPPFFVRGPSICIPKSKAWHGDPMAALTRAFRVLGPNHRLLPPELLELSGLCQDNDLAAKTAPLKYTERSRGPGTDPHNGGPDQDAKLSVPDPNSKQFGGGLVSQGQPACHGRGGSERGRERGRGRGHGRGKARAQMAMEDTPRKAPHPTSQKRDFDYSDIEAAQELARVKPCPWVWGPTATSGQHLEWERERTRNLATTKTSRQPRKSAAKQKRYGAGRGGSGLLGSSQIVYGGGDEFQEGRIQDWLSGPS
ncbi:MAG: hypothetical protein Q9169_008700 [Polycauliona sp. 2 TL-2023]